MVSPAASSSRVTCTVTRVPRVPRITGFPCTIAGSTEIPSRREAVLVIGPVLQANGSRLGHS